MKKFNGVKHLLYIIDDALNIFSELEKNSILDSLKQLELDLKELLEGDRKVHVLILATHGEKTLGRITQITLPEEHILGIEYLL